MKQFGISGDYLEWKREREEALHEQPKENTVSNKTKAAILLIAIFAFTAGAVVSSMVHG